MRFLLIALCLALLVAAGWHATQVGTQRSGLRGAPQIQALVDRRVTDAIAGLAEAEISVRTDGRTVAVEGQLASRDTRDAALGAARSIGLVARVRNRLTVLETVSPFTLSVEKAPDGALRLDGYVPSRRLEDRILADAKRLSVGGQVSSNLQMAAGAPEGDWAGMVGSGLLALSHLASGRLQIADDTVTLSGDIPDAAAAHAASAAIAAAPMGEWTSDLTGAPPEGGFAFSAMKAPDGSMVVDGFAPDEETRTALLNHVERVSGQAVSGQIKVASGMPDPEWPARVMRGLDVLGQAGGGLLTINADGVSLAVDVETDADAERLSALADPAWAIAVTVKSPTPDGTVTITLEQDGLISATGRLPEGIEPAEFYAALPGIDLAGIDTGARGRPADWTGPLQGLAIVFPRFRTATARLDGRRLSMSGVLKRGFSATGSEAALRTVLDRTWMLELALRESAPLAEVMLSKRDGEVAISGVLPTGLSPAEVLDLLGDQAGGDGLTGGGDGDPESWRAGLSAFGASLQLFDHVTARMAGRSLEMTGVLNPGYAAGEARDWLVSRLGDTWSADVSAEETAAGEGDRRTNLTTGEIENFRRGFWLPHVEFPVSAKRCKQEIDRVLKRDQIVFVSSSAEIDREGRALLNHLAAVAVRCLNSSALRVEIVGHTDSVGNDAANQRLSEERAKSVMDAMAARGVRPDAMNAIGYGESRPIASNDTPEGRAQNRRIAFAWFENEN